MNTEIITTVNQGELLNQVDNNFEMLRERVAQFYPDLQQVFPIARFIANVGLFKPIRSFNSFSTREELSKSVKTVGPYNYLTYNNVRITACDLSFEYDFNVFWFLVCMVFKTGSTKIKFSTSNFMYFKDKNTKHSNKTEADKLYKSLERHYTIDVQYEQKLVDISYRFMSGIKRIGEFEFEVDIVPAFFNTYLSDNGYIIPFEREQVIEYKQELAKKIHFFLSGSKFTGALKCSYVGFCHSMGFALNGNKLDKLSKSRLKEAFESCIADGILLSYKIEEGRDEKNKKYPTGFVFYVGESKPKVTIVENKPAKKEIKPSRTPDDEYAEFDDFPSSSCFENKSNDVVTDTSGFDEYLDDLPTDFFDEK